MEKETFSPRKVVTFSRMFGQNVTHTHTPRSDLFEATKSMAEKSCVCEYDRSPASESFLFHRL